MELLRGPFPGQDESKEHLQLAEQMLWIAARFSPRIRDNTKMPSDAPWDATRLPRNEGNRIAISHCPLLEDSQPPRKMEDLDVSRLAEYLHVTPDQVTRMAVRGKLPGRRVGGDWRFNEAEIHHWLEDRIGASDSEELTKVQRVVDRVAGEAFGRPISELCSKETIAVPLNARTRGSVIRSMCELASRSGLVWDAPAMAEAVQAREQMHPTALDCGVALLHPRRPQTSILADSVLAMAVCPSPIPFSDTGQLTDIFFLICSYDDAAHLRILARLSRLIADGDLLTNLRGCLTVAEAWECLREAEEALDSALH